MTFSFNLILGLFLLAPGFAVFAGIYHGSQFGPVRSPPPPPGSILALAIVTFGALAAHFLGALLFWFQDAICLASRRCIPVAFDPNAYDILFNLAFGKAPLKAPEAAEILGSLICLSIGCLLATRALAQTRPLSKILRGVLYGWLGDVVIATGPNEAVLAYVLSDVQNDGTVVGYEGVVANMTTNAEKEITSVLLSSCETFYLRVSPKGVVRREGHREIPIRQLYLDRSHIKNIAFEPVRFKDP